MSRTVGAIFSCMQNSKNQGPLTSNAGVRPPRPAGRRLHVVGRQSMKEVFIEDRSSQRAAPQSGRGRRELTQILWTVGPCRAWTWDATWGLYHGSYQSPYKRSMSFWLTRTVLRSSYTSNGSRIRTSNLVKPWDPPAIDLARQAEARGVCGEASKDLHVT